MIKRIAAAIALLLVPCLGYGIDQGYTNFKSSINVTGLMTGTTVQVSGEIKLKDGTVITSTNTLPGGISISTNNANGLSLSTSNILSLGLSSGNANGALRSTDWTTFNNKLSTTSAASTYVTQASATQTYFQPANATTSNLPEGSRLYFTTARATSAISETAPITYSNGVVGIDKSSATLLGPSPTTSNIPEGSNLYYTTARTTSAISATPPITYSNGVVGIDGSFLSTTTAANTYLTQSSATATYQQLSSSGSFLTTSSATATYDQKTDSIAASRVASGSLGSGVIASSIAVNAVTNPSIVSMDGSKITGTASIPNASIDGSSITKQGNTFNTGSNLLQLSGGLVPNANVDTSSITKQGNAFNGNSQLVQTTSGGLLPALSAANLTSIPAGNLTGTVPNSTLDSSSVTKYGPNIPAAAISAGSLGSSVIASSIAVSGVTAGSYGSATQVPAITFGGDGRATSASNTTISLTNSNLQSGTYSNVTVPAANVAAGSLGGSVIASSIAVSGVSPATYGSATQSAVVVVAGDGRITSASNSTITPAASSITSGSLASNVIASSIAVNAVTNPSIVSMDGSKITGTASIPNASIDGSSVTKYGTSIPANSIASGSLGSSVIASSIAVNAVQDASIVGVSASKLTGTGTLPNATVDGSSITKQGNTFNGASQLLKLDSGGGFSISAATITNIVATTLVNNGASVVALNSNGVGVLGTNTGDDAVAGRYGEYVSSSALNVNVGSSGAYFDLVSLTLTGGDWDISIVAFFNPNGATITGSPEIGIGSASGNNGAGLTSGDTDVSVPPTVSGGFSASIPNVRVPASGTFTRYFKVFISYSVATPKMYGRMSARRMR